MGGDANRTYWNERLRRHWGPHGVGSLAYGRYYNRWLYRVRRRAFVEVCRRLALDLHRASVLDIGCGTGFYIEQWRALGARHVAGLDFSSVAIERLRARFPDVVLYEADIGEPAGPLPSDAFDVVGAFDVLFHVVDDRRYERALRHIATALRRGGHLLYSDCFLRASAQQYLDYWRARPLRDIERSLRDAGFEILGRVPVFVLMNSPVDAASRHYRRLWDAAMTPARRSEIAGLFIGGLLFPIELILRRLVSEGPSSEIMLCRKL